MDTGQRLRLMLTAAIPFVMALRKETGGFGATRRLPATIQDTYHALNILTLCRQYGIPGPGASLAFAEDNLHSFLAACRRLLPATGIATAFQLLWSCRTVGVEFDQGDVEAAILARMRASESVEEWYYCARIESEILGKKPLAGPEGQHLARVLARGWRCVDEAWQHMYLARAGSIPLPVPDQELIAWLQANQNGDGGFGFFPGTTSFVENCHASLRALMFLNATPLNPKLAADFLAACQTAAGGFSRNSRAAPFLDTTWHALAAFSLLRTSQI